MNDNHFLDRIGQGLVMLVVAGIVVGVIKLASWLWHFFSHLFS